MAEIIIRKLEEDNAEALGSLLQNTFEELAEVYYPPEIIAEEARAFSSHHLQAMLGEEKRIFLGAFAGDALCGTLFGADDGAGVFFEQWVAVNPAFRGRRIMRGLCEALEIELRERGFYKLLFLVSIKNIPAIERYLHMGYNIEGVHPNHAGGWHYLSFGRIITPKIWTGKVTEQPDFDMARAIHFYAEE